MYQQENHLTEELKSATSESSKLIDHILEVKSTNGSNNYDSLSLLHQRIYAFLVFKNKQICIQKGPNTPGYDNIQKEVNAALESVIPRNALSPFIMLTNPEKVTQLAELSNLVLGIRLFNKEIDKGGQSLEKIENLASKFDSKFIEDIQVNLTRVKNTIDDYTYFLMSVEGGHANERLKKELIFLRQYMTYMSSLAEKTEASLSLLENSKNRFVKEVQDLRILLENNSSAPKEKVYPKFSMLSTTYLSMLEESKVAQSKEETFKLLISILNEVKFTMTEAQRSEAERYMTAMQKEEEKPIKFENKNGVYFIEPRNTPEFLETPLDLAGFCLVSLVDKGVIVPGEHPLGVFKYQDLMLVFHSFNEINKFLDRPQHYFTQFYNLCRKNPALIILLNIEDHFKEKKLKLLEIKEDFKDATKTMTDFQQQTLVHASEKNFQHNYFWNEWELRKRAIQMANIRNMTTKASQTSDSIFKVENETQVWLMKDACTMTGGENGTNPIRPRNYITELREKTNS